MADTTDGRLMSKEVFKKYIDGYYRPDLALKADKAEVETALAEKIGFESSGDTVTITIPDSATEETST